MAKSSILKNEYVQNMVAKIKGLNFTIGAVEFGPGNCVDRVFLSSEINQRGQWFQLIFFPGSSKLEVSNRVVAQGGRFEEPAKCLWKNVIDCSFNGALFNFYEVVIHKISLFLNRMLFSSLFLKGVMCLSLNKCVNMDRSSIC